MSRPRIRPGHALLPLLLTLPAACGDRGPGATTGGAAPLLGSAARPMPAGHRRMIQVLEDVRLRTAAENPYQGDAEVRGFRAALDALAADAPAVERWKILSRLGEGEVLLGREVEGIAHLEEADRLLPAVRDALPPGWPEEQVFRLGVAWLRLGETRNCCARNSPESCLLPLAGAALHTDPEGARRAIACFRRILEGEKPGTPMALQSIWLLNIAHMALGEYPDGVPEAWRIPPATFASGEPFPRFPNVAGSLGLDTFGLSGGVVADDFDGDGNLDLLVSNQDTAAPLRFFRNRGDGTFEERSAAAGLAGILGGLNLVQADYDDDGDLDVLVLRGAWFGPAGRTPNSLLRNEGDGTFTDVTFDAGLGRVSWPTQVAAWADYDGDGDLDLFVGNETTPALAAPCQLFRNEGNGTFTDVAVKAGVTNDGFTKGASWGDYDGDGRPDLYVSNLGAPNRLYRNEGDGTFTDVAARLGVEGPVDSFPAWFWDFDQDGILDIFVGGFPGRPSDLAAAALGLPFTAGLPRLYRGDGKGGFEEVAARCDLRSPASPMGANFGDVDGDGFPDFYLGTGNTGLRDVMPNRMWRNREGRSFVDVTTAGGFGHLQKGHGIAFADLDNDGDLDVFAEMGGAYPGDRFHDALFENPGFGNRWLQVRLVGTRSNRSAFGARIRAEAVGPSGTRNVFAVVGSGGSFGANPLRQFLGLGKATRVPVLEITWPATGKRQVLRDPPLDRCVQIVEGEASWTEIPLRRFRLGGK